MLSIGIGEIQKNSSIFSNLSETIQIVDKRKKKILAMVYPVKNQSIIGNLAAKYRDRIDTKSLNLDQVKEQAMTKAMADKYDLST